MYVFVPMMSDLSDLWIGILAPGLTVVEVNIPVRPPGLVYLYGDDEGVPWACRYLSSTETCIDIQARKRSMPCSEALHK